MATWSGLLKAAALRSNVASSKFHFGEASCQMSFAKIVPVLLVAGPASLSREIVLVPPRELGLGGNGILLAAGLPIR